MTKKLNISFTIILIYLTTCLVSDVKAIDCKIKLNSIKNNEKFCHQLVLIRGTIECPKLLNSYPNSIDPVKGRFIKVKTSSKKQDNWPVNSFHQFKALVRLVKGNNKVSLSYEFKEEKASFNINLVYGENENLAPVSLVIFLTKDSPGVFDMDKESLKKGEKNNLESAIKRLQTAGLLWQALTSDSLESFGLGRKSFRLELDNRNKKLTKDPIVHLVKSELTRAQLHEKEIVSDQELHKEATRAIRDSPIYKNKSLELREKTVFATLLLDSRWDAKSKRTILHAALGGGNVGIFGSHLTHAWPENENQLINRLLDTTRIDFSQLANDASPTKSESLNVGIGALLHEVGHALGLPHSDWGIMNRSWFFNKFFLSIAKDGFLKTFIPIRDRLDEEKTGWFTDHAKILSNHPIIKDSLNFAKKLNGQDLLSWQVKNKDHFFNQISSSEWLEILDGKNVFSFETVDIKSNKVIISDKSRSIFISLDKKEAKFGDKKDKISNSLYVGSWNDLKLWKAVGKNQQFKRSFNNQWIEVVEGTEVFKFDFVGSKKRDQILLFAADRGFYLSLNEKEVKFGNTKENIDALLVSGSWAKS